jgi:hypothetical protein
MNLKNLQTWVKRFTSVGSNAAPNESRTPRSPEQTRTDRASSVVELRKDVRTLQQEISDLIDAKERGDVATGSTGHAAQMAALQRRLAEKQTELAKYQARV